MKKNILSLICFFPLLAFGIEAYAPKDNNPELEKIDMPVALGELPKLTLEKKIMRAHNVAFFYTQSQTGFKQTGDGQSYDTEVATGNGFFATYNKALVSGNEIDFKIWMNNARFAEPTDIGGEDIAVAKNLFSGLYSWSWNKDQRSWELALGATILSQNSDTFTSQEKLVSHYSAIGPTLGLGLKYQLGINWKLKTKLATSLPIYFQEYGGNSGYHRLSLHYLATLLLERQLNNRLAFNIGLMAEGEDHRFNGTGQRGVEDAQISTFSYAIPIGVSYAF